MLRRERHQSGALFLVLCALVSFGCSKSYPPGRDVVNKVELVDANSIDADELEDKLATTGCTKFLGLFRGIVYDYEAAHLLHSFIARATEPVFYDAIDEDGLDDLIGQLVIAWPEPFTPHIRAANDPMLKVVAAEADLAIP